jgi:hypothetical protein
MKPVLSKDDFVRRYATGEFGNHAPTWDTLDEYLKSRYEGLVHIRNRVKGGPTYYNVLRGDILSVWTEATRKQASETWYISAMAPTEKTVLQGEVQRGVWGLDLTYTRVKKPMREALKEKQLNSQGVGAIVALQSTMDTASWEHLLYLLKVYPDHVVEFSVYEECWGTVPGYNTVFWEVRKY